MFPSLYKELLPDYNIAFYFIARVSRCQLNHSVAAIHGWKISRARHIFRKADEQTCRDCWCQVAVESKSNTEW